MHSKCNRVGLIAIRHKKLKPTYYRVIYTELHHKNMCYILSQLKMTVTARVSAHPTQIDSLVGLLTEAKIYQKYRCVGLTTDKPSCSADMSHESTHAIFYNDI